MKDFELMLAPMEGHTGPEFRELCHKKGADSTFTEMARISGLARRNKSTLQKIMIPRPVPTYIQLIGSNVKDLDRFLIDFDPPKGFLGFDLNLGCSSPNIVQIGLGSALIKRTSKVKTIIRTIRDHSHPASIKLRLGMNKFEKEKKVYLNLINEVDADFFIVHARYGTQTLEDPADFSVYNEIVKTNKTIIANGDIATKKQVQSLKGIGLRRCGEMLHGAASQPQPLTINFIQTSKSKGGGRRRCL